MTLLNMKLPSVPPSPVWAMGGSPGHIKKVRTAINPIPQGGRVRMLQNLQATLARTCQHGSLSVAEADHAGEDAEVPLIVVPEAPRMYIHINDNYCVTKPDLENRCSGTVTETLRTLKSLVNYCAVSPVPFATRNVRQPQKKGLSPLSEVKEINYVNCVSFVDHCVSAPTVINAHNVVHAPLVGGRRQPFWQTWALLGANSRVVSILKEGYVLPFKLKPPLVRHPLIVSGYANPNRNKFLREAVQSLVDKKAVEMVRVRASLAFFNRLFIVPKPSQKWRPVLDLSALDFSDAYFHIPVHVRSRKYLRFHFQNQSYQFRALPFGLSTAQMEFTGVVKEVKLIAQSRGIRIHQYLDDWLIQDPTKESCYQGTQSLLTLCQELGWIVNLQKSELEPKQIFEFVGYKYDLSQGLVLPTPLGVDPPKVGIHPVQTKLPSQGIYVPDRPTYSNGKTGSPGETPHETIQWHLKRHWRVPESLEKEIPVPRSLHPHLLWWTKETNVLTGQPLHPLIHAVQIFTDASKEGWGAHLGDFTARGIWSVPESHLHINFLELKAVLLALKIFQHLVQGKVVLVATDNTTVVAYINKEGGMRSGSLCALLWRLLCWCNLRQVVLKARHIPGRLNVIADKLSRQGQVFDLLVQTWHRPHVDMFATKYNCKLTQYVSPVPDPSAWAVDTLTVSWENLDMYVFPQYLLGKVLTNKNLIY